MKVKELMALLSLRDPEALVCVPSPDWETYDGTMASLKYVDSLQLDQSIVELS